MAQRIVKLKQQLAQPSGLSDTVGNSLIFCFSTRTRHLTLPFRRPGDQVVTRENNIACSGLTSVRTTRPISIRVNSEGVWNSSREKKPMIKSVLKRPKNTLYQSQMRFPRIMHIETNLLHRVGNVRTGERQILQGSSQTVIVSRIRHRVTSTGKLGVSVDRCAAWLTSRHPGILKYVHGILTL